MYVFEITMILVFVFASILLEGIHGQPPLGTSQRSTVHHYPTGEQVQTTQTDTFQPLHSPGFAVRPPIIRPSQITEVSTHIDPPGSLHNPLGHTAVQHTTTTNTRVQPPLGHVGHVGPVGYVGHVGTGSVPVPGSYPRATGLVGRVGGLGVPLPGLRGPFIGGRGVALPGVGFQRQTIGSVGNPLQDILATAIGGLGASLFGLQSPAIGGRGIHRSGLGSVGLATRPYTSPLGYGAGVVGHRLGVPTVVGAHAAERHSSSVDTHIDVNNHHNPSPFPVVHTSHTSTSERRPGISTIGHGHGVPLRVAHVGGPVGPPGIGLAGALPVHGGGVRSSTSVERHVDHGPSGLPVKHVVRTESHRGPAIPDVVRPFGPPLDVGPLVGGVDFGIGGGEFDRRRMGDRESFRDMERQRRRQFRRMRRRRRFD